MDKTSQKLTKDKELKRVDAGRKGRENFMKKMKEDVLHDAKKGGGDITNSSNETTRPTTNASNETNSSTNNSSNETSSITNNATTRSNGTYVYGLGIVAVLAIGVCVFFAYSTFQNNNKKLINEKKDRPQRLHIFKNLYNKWVVLTGKKALKTLLKMG